MHAHLAFGFWLLAPSVLASGLYLLHFGAKISDLRAICCSLEPICMPIWLLASGSFGFWLLACICCILEPKSLICVLFAAVRSQFACPFGFWLLASGSFGFWLLACICCILEPKFLICVLFAAVWSQFACPFGFWLWLHLTLGFWFLFFVVFLALVSLGFWLLAALLLNVCVVL